MRKKIRTGHKEFIETRMAYQGPAIASPSFDPHAIGFNRGVPRHVLMEHTGSLRAFLETGEDWERKNTSLKGVSIIKLPQTKSRPASLAIEINPPNEKGAPMKKKGIMIMGRGELFAFRELFNNEKVEALLETIVAPGKRQSKSEKEDILEI